MEKYDLIIIGAGPAGINAAIYAQRYQLKTLIFGQMPGGSAVEANVIENLFGYPKIKGIELLKNISQQIAELNIDLQSEKVISVKKLSSKNQYQFTVKTEKAEYQSKKIILATGTKRRKLNLENEEKFAGKGIHYCATCDAAFYKNKNVAIIGGGNSAITSALLLSEFAKNTYLIHRGSAFLSAEPAWVKQLESNKKIEKIFNANVVEVLGSQHLEKIKLDNKQELEIDGLFIEIGSDPNTEIAQNLGIEIKDKFITTDKNQETNIKGIFAAGDTTDYPLKQIITAASQGAVAAYSAYNQIQEEKNENS
jgi:thioredoxin reductase (NADPH)